MKAKEYAAQYKQSPTKEMLSDILLSFWLEIETLKNQRKVKTDAGLLGILNELNDKWYAFCNLLQKDSIFIHPSGFQVLIKNMAPDILLYWKPKPFVVEAHNEAKPML